MVTNCCPLALKGHGHCINYRVKNKKAKFMNFVVFIYY
jgi:hypothetical protein